MIINYHYKEETTVVDTDIQDGYWYTTLTL